MSDWLWLFAVVTTALSIVVYVGRDDLDLPGGGFSC